MSANSHCTTDSNKEKIDDIPDISNELTQKIETDKVRIYPILITQVEASKISSSLDTAKARGAKVITIDNIMVLLKEIRDGNRPYEVAKSFLL